MAAIAPAEYCRSVSVWGAPLCSRMLARANTRSVSERKHQNKRGSISLLDVDSASGLYLNRVIQSSRIFMYLLKSSDGTMDIDQNDAYTPILTKAYYS